MQTTPDLIHREFLARVLPDLDPLRQGRYSVHIPDLMHGIEESGGIWAKNHTHKQRMTTSDKGEYGQYFPLQSGTMVIVKFFDEDINTAYIDRIVSDWSTNSNVLGQDCTEVAGAETDRDEQYIIFKTAKKWSAFYVNEDTSKEPNTMYLIFNRDKAGRRTVLRVDETGISWYTRDNRRVRIKLDDNLQVDGNRTEYIKGYDTRNVDGDLDMKTMSKLRMESIDDMDIKTSKNFKLEATQNIDIKTPQKVTIEATDNITFKTPSTFIIDAAGGVSCQASGGGLDLYVTGTCNTTVTGTCNVDAAKINLNCGNQIAKPTAPPAQSAATAKPKTCVRDLGPNESSEYSMGEGLVEGRPIITSKKCDDATKKHNTGLRKHLNA